jgi:hypothetical protein
MKNQKENREKITVELKNKIIILSIEEFDLDCDMDEFTKIHHYNIMGELITCQVALNRIGILLAEYEQILSECKLDFEIFYAQYKEEQRKKLEFSIADAKGNIKINKPTLDEVESSVIRLPQYKVKKINLFKIEKNRDIVKSFYWSMQGKTRLLENISSKLKPEEFENEIIEEKINGILIKKVNKAIK